jgi:hypothetical protein
MVNTSEERPVYNIQGNNIKEGKIVLEDIKPWGNAGAWYVVRI